MNLAYRKSSIKLPGAYLFQAHLRGGRGLFGRGDYLI